MMADDTKQENPDLPPHRGRGRLVAGLLGLGVLALVLMMAYRQAMHARTSDSPSAGERSGFALHPEPRQLPSFGFKDAMGRSLTLADFRGKVVLLNLWATWCPPCRKEMPTLDRLQARLGGPDFEVVALSVDQGGPAVVKAFFDQIDARALTLYIDESTEVLSALGILGVPATLLIDREGREVGRMSGPAEWDSPEMVRLIETQIAGGA
jgi:thiol-disulfide isomerase/thioredoxin